MRRLLHALTISTTLERCQSFGHPVPAGWRRRGGNHEEPAWFSLGNRDLRSAAYRDPLLRR